MDQTTLPPNPRDLMLQEAIEAQDARNQQTQQTNQEQQEKQEDDARQTELIQTIDAAVKTIINWQATHNPKVTVLNQKEFPNSISTPDISQVVEALQEVKQSVDSTKPDDTAIVDSIKSLAEAVDKLPKSIEFPEMPEPVEEVTVKNQPDYKPDFSSLEDAVKSIDVKPSIKVEKSSLDTTPITDALTSVLQAIQSIPTPTIPKIDDKGLKQAINDVQKTIENLRFPVPNFSLPFSSNGIDTKVDVVSQGGQNAAVVTAVGGLPVGGPSLFTKSYDELDASYGSTTTTFISKLATVVQETITITFTDSTKQNFQTIVRS